MAGTSGRAACSTVWDFFLGPISEEPGKKGVAESRRYDKEVRKQGKKGHNMGNADNVGRQHSWL